MTDLAREYGMALYQLAEEEQLDQQILEEFSVLAGQFEENPEYLELLSTPALQKSQRLQIADETFRGRIHVYLLDFIKILIQREAAQQLPQCWRQYEKLYNQRHNIERATAVTAVPLSPQLRDKLLEKLEQISGKTILLENRVDPAVIGGVSIQMDGKELDDSLKSRLETLRGNLLQVIV